MHQKQKINQAAQRLKKGTHLYLPYLKNNQQWEEFHQAQAEEKAIDFIQNQLLQVSLATRENLVSCYQLQEQIDELEYEKTRMILSGPISDYEEYERAADKGILVEREWWQWEIKNSTHANAATILRLIEQEIALIDPKTEAVLSVAEPIPSDSFEAIQNKRIQRVKLLVVEKETIELSELLLRCIAPSSSFVFLPFSKELKEKIAALLMARIRDFVIGETDLSNKEKQEILKNEARYMQYLSQQNEVECVACLAVLADLNAAAIIENPAYLAHWFHIGNSYQQLGFLVEQDYEALLRLDEFLLQQSEKIRQATQLRPQDKHLVITQLHSRLGKLYQYFWEWKKALSFYQQRVRLEIQAKEYLNVEGTLMSIVDCLKDHFQYSFSLEICYNFLNGDLTKLGVKEPFTISTTFRQALEVRLLELVDIVNPAPNLKKRYLTAIKSAAIKSLQSMMEAIETEDAISQEQVTILQKEHQQFFDELANTFEDTHDSTDQFQYRFDQLIFFDGEVDAYRQVLEQLAPLLPQQTADWQLAYQLHSAKLKYFERDRSAISDYQSLIPQIATYSLFDTGQRFNWLIEYIRAISLEIAEAPSQLYPRIQSICAEALQLQTTLFLEGYQENITKQGIIIDFEKVYRALLLNIEATEQKGVSAPNVSSPLNTVQQSLLQLLWTCMEFHQQMLNNFTTKSNVRIIDSTAHLQLEQQLKNLLSSYYLEGQLPLKEKINYLANKIYDLEIPNFNAPDRLQQIKHPLHRSMLFHLFTKMDKERILLILHYDGQQYQYKAYQQFQQIEELLHNFEDQYAIGWEQWGIVSLLQNPDSFQQVSQPLTYFFGDTTKDVSVYLDRLRSFSKPKSETLSTTIQLFLDSFLHTFPLEIIPYRNTTQVLGTTYSLSNVFLRQQPITLIQPYNGIAIFGGVPQVGPFSALVHTMEECEQIKQQFDKRNYPVYEYPESKATIENLKNCMVTNAPTILHLAVHGVADTQLPPETCSLILTPESTPTSALLTYADIIKMNLTAVDLVVLSACNSSTGKISKSTPMQGLAYAFLAAGASFVVASRVKTKDKATKEWMNRFYSYLFKTNIQDAMRLTRQYFLEENTSLAREDIAAWGLWS